MVEPTVTPRIKQRHNLARNRIDTGQVRAFPEIAAVTGKGQIAGIVRPTMLAGYDMLYMMRKGTIILRKEAIFTTIAGSRSDEYPRRRLHRYMASESCLRAFNFRIATKSSALMSASYSARSSSLSKPSLARSASISTLSCTDAETSRARTRRADSASRQRLSGSRN
jgi:hypothetical protein